MSYPDRDQNGRTIGDAAVDVAGMYFRYIEFVLKIFIVFLIILVFISFTRGPSGQPPPQTPPVPPPKDNFEVCHLISRTTSDIAAERARALLDPTGIHGYGPPRGSVSNLVTRDEKEIERERALARIRAASKLPWQYSSGALNSTRAPSNSISKYLRDALGRCPAHPDHDPDCDLCQDLLPDPAPEVRRFDVERDWSREKMPSSGIDAIYVPDHEPLFT